MMALSTAVRLAFVLLTATAPLVSAWPTALLPGGSYCSGKSGYNLIVAGAGMYGVCYPYSYFFGLNYTWDTTTNVLQWTSTESTLCYIASVLYAPGNQSLLVWFSANPSATVYTMGSCNASIAPTQPLCGSQGTIQFANNFFVLQAHKSNTVVWGTQLSTTSFNMANYGALFPRIGNWSADRSTFMVTLSMIYYGSSPMGWRFTSYGCGVPSTPAPVKLRQPYCTSGYSTPEPSYGTATVVFFEKGIFTMTFNSTSRCNAIGTYESTNSSNIDFTFDVYFTSSCVISNSYFIMGGFGYDASSDTLSMMIYNVGAFTIGNCNALPSPLMSGSYCAGYNAALVVAGTSFAMRVDDGTYAVGQYTFASGDNTTYISAVVVSGPITTSYFYSLPNPLSVNSGDGSIAVTIGVAPSSAYYSTVQLYDVSSYTFTAAQCAIAPALMPAVTYWVQSRDPRALFSGPLSFRSDGTYSWLLNGTAFGNLPTCGSAFIQGSAMVRDGKVTLRSRVMASLTCANQVFVSNVTLLNGDPSNIVMRFLPSTYLTSRYWITLNGSTAAVPPPPAQTFVADGLYCGTVGENITVTSNRFVWLRPDGSSTVGSFVSASAVSVLAVGQQLNYAWMPYLVDTASAADTITFAANARYSYSEYSYAASAMLSTTSVSSNGCGSDRADVPVGAYCAANVLNGTFTITFAPGRNFALVFEPNTKTSTATCIAYGTAWMTPSSGYVSLLTKLPTTSSCSAKFGVQKVTWSASAGLTVTFTLDGITTQTFTSTGCGGGPLPSGAYCGDPSLNLGTPSKPFIAIAGTWMSVYVPTLSPPFYVNMYNVSGTNVTVNPTAFTPAFGYNFSVTTTDGVNLRFNRDNYNSTGAFLSITLNTDFCGTPAPSPMQLKTFLVSNEVMSNNQSATMTLNYDTFIFTFSAAPGTTCLMQGTFGLSSTPSGNTLGSVYYTPVAVYYSPCTRSFLSNFSYSTSSGTASIDVWFNGNRTFLTFGNPTATCVGTGALTPVPRCALQSTTTLYSCNGYYAVTSLVSTSTVAYVGTLRLTSSVIEIGVLVLNTTGNVTALSTPWTSTSPVSTLIAGPDPNTGTVLWSKYPLTGSLLVFQTCSMTGNNNMASFNASTVRAAYAAQQALQMVPVGPLCGTRPMYLSESTSLDVSAYSLPGNALQITYVNPGLSDCAWSGVVGAVGPNGELTLASAANNCYVALNAVQLYGLTYQAAQQTLVVSAAWVNASGSLPVTWTMNSTTCAAWYQSYGAAYTFYSTAPGQGTYTGTVGIYQLTAITMANLVAACVVNLNTSAVITQALVQYFNYSTGGLYASIVNGRKFFGASLLSASGTEFTINANTNGGVSVMIATTLQRSPYYVTPPPTAPPTPQPTPVPTPAPTYTPSPPDVNTPTPPLTPTPFTPPPDNVTPPPTPVPTLAPPRTPAPLVTASPPFVYTPTPTYRYTPTPPYRYPTPAPTSGGGAAADAPSGLSGGNGVAVGVIGAIAGLAFVGGGIFVFLAMKRASASAAAATATGPGSIQMTPFMPSPPHAASRPYQPPPPDSAYSTL